MKSNEEKNRLLQEKKKLEEELLSLNFKGYPEVKNAGNNKYIYLRYKSYDKNSSHYVGVYSEELYNSLKLLAKDARNLKTKIRIIKYRLSEYGYKEDKLSSSTIKCINFVRSNLKYIVYGQCVVEGVAASFLDTEEILNDNDNRNVSFTDTLKIKNLKNAWQYVLDEDTLKRDYSLYSILDISSFVNDRLMSYEGRLRDVDIHVTGSSFKPPLPSKEKCIKDINSIINSKELDINKAIDIFCYISKNQLFVDGNKRTALIAMNLYLIKKGLGYISISQEKEKKFKMLLIDFYESKNDNIKSFLKNECFHKLTK